MKAIFIKRTLLILALSAPVVLFLGLAFQPVNAQVKYVQPQFKWTCSRCGGLVWQGTRRPTVAKCPRCGIQLRSDSNSNSFYPKRNRSPRSTPTTSEDAITQNPVTNTQIALFLGGAIVVVFVGWWFYFKSA